MSFRNPKYIDRYEDVLFDLEYPLDINVANKYFQET